MDVGQAVMVAGIGCRSGVSAEQVEAAIEAAMGAVNQAPAAATEGGAAAGMPGRTLAAIATPAAKASEPGIKAVATARGVPLMLITQPDLEAADAGTVTRSAQSMAAMNVHSVAEAAALAGAAAMANAAARLLAPRIAVGPVTCALAETEK